MERAVVLVGVRKSGDLPVLQAVDSGLAEMLAWATSQDIPGDLVTILSDTDGQVVRAADVRKAVTSFANRGTLEQLIVYFSGHGMYKGQSEYWLFRDAPGDRNDAINVGQSILEARQGHVPHVVLISDACRTLPPTIAYDNVNETSIFPNPKVMGEAEVDVFYACRLGDVSREIRDPNVASRAYHALYTEVVAKALQGGYREVRLEPVRDSGTVFHVVRPYPLKRALRQLVAAHASALGATMVNQRPQSLVTSDPEVAWLSKIAAPASSGAATESDGNEPSLEFEPPPTDPDIDDAVAAASRLANPSDPGHIEASSAIYVQGTAVKEAYSGSASAKQVAEGLVHVQLTDNQPDSTVLLHLMSGHCAVVPALLGRVGTVTVEGDQLVDLSYAPLTQGQNGGSRKHLGSNYVNNRAWIAAASRFGIAWWEDVDLVDLVKLFEDYGQADPSLAVYLAYAFTDLGRRDLIGELLIKDNEKGSRVPFDVMLLAGSWGRPVIPFTPLLSRGWALLGLLPSNVCPDLPPPLASHWTLFAEADIPRLREFLKQ